MHIHVYVNLIVGYTKHSSFVSKCCSVYNVIPTIDDRVIIAVSSVEIKTCCVIFK